VIFFIYTILHLMSFCHCMIDTVGFSRTFCTLLIIGMKKSCCLLYLRRLRPEFLSWGSSDSAFFMIKARFYTV
jgi:hypothetical protein